MSQTAKPSIPEFGVDSFDHVNLPAYPERVYVIWAGVTAMPIWIIMQLIMNLIGPSILVQQYGPAVAALALTGLPAFSGLIAGATVFFKKKATLMEASRKNYLYPTLRFEEDEHAVIPFEDLGFRTLPPNWLPGFTVWQHRVRIPLGGWSPFRDKTQPINWITFVSEGSKAENIHYQPGSTPWGNYILNRTNVARIDTVFYKSLRPELHGPPVPIFQIVGSPYIAQKIQRKARVKSLTAEELLKLETQIIETTAHSQEIRAETAEKQLDMYRGAQFDLSWKAETEKHRMEEWDKGANDTNQPGVWTRLSKRMKITIVTVVVVAFAVAGLVALFVRGII